MNTKSHQSNSKPQQFVPESLEERLAFKEQINGDLFGKTNRTPEASLSEPSRSRSESVEKIEAESVTGFPLNREDMNTK